MDTGIENTWGNYLWHVKQSNNGILFLLSKSPLEFERIKEQNNDSPLYKGRGIPESIIHTDLEKLNSAAKTTSEELEAKLTNIRTITDQSVAESITNDLLIHTQGMLVRYLHEFLDECY